MQVNPWDRQPKESEEAYAAFLKYRDMGAARTVDAVSIAIYGKREHSKRVSNGRVGKWSADHGWVERCIAWDNHLQAQRQVGIDKATRDEAEEWERRRQQQTRDDFALAQQFLKQARTLAMFPMTEQTASKDGRSTVIRPIPPRDLKDAASIARDAQAMAWAAINQAIPPDDEDDFDPETATLEECRAYMEGKARRRKARGGGP